MFSSLKSYNSRVRVALKSHFLPLESSNFDLGDLEKVMFQVVARLSELVFFLLTSPNADWVKSKK